MNYKITNIEYGIGTLPTDFVYGNTGNQKSGESEPQVFSITLLQGNDMNILVDTGVNTDDPEKVVFWNNYSERMLGTAWALKQVDLTPDDIDFVILTHIHADHVGALELFTNAQVYLQRKELEEWERMCADSRYLQVVLPAVMPKDLPYVRALIDNGRATCLDGDVRNLLPGISVHVVHDGHSVVDQLVVVDTEQGEYVVAGDIACRPANLLGMGEWPGFLAPSIGRSGSTIKLFDAYKWVLDKIDGNIQHLVLAHDTTMSERFETASLDDKLSIHFIVK